MIDCPIDGRKNITTNVCPQCRTDLTPLIYLRDLPGKIFLEGKQLIESNNRDQAIEKIILAIGLNPLDTEYYLALGQLYLSLGRLNEALNCCESVIKIDPENKNAILLRESCNQENKLKELKLKNELKKRRVILFLLLLLPFITLIIGFIIYPGYQKRFQKEPDHLAIVKEVNGSYGLNGDLKKYSPKVFFSVNTYFLRGDVPDSLRRNLAYTILTNILEKNNLLQVVKIKNNIGVKTLQEFFDYSVRPGDNLFKISSLFLGSPKKWKIVFAANKDKIISPHKLIVGQHIQIPLTFRKN